VFVILHANQRGLGFTAGSQYDALTSKGDTVDKFGIVMLDLSNTYMGIVLGLAPSLTSGYYNDVQDTYSCLVIKDGLISSITPRGPVP